ncbi:MAG: GNAT family N-acetyltransferase [Chlorobi bacterium]|nr:GNAT family N-acetyltransferase [Chlorobiota bacterium]
MTTIIVDDGFELRPVTPASAQTIFKSIIRSGDHLRRWLPFIENTKSVGDTRRFIKTTIKTPCPKKDMIFEISVNNVFAGLISLKEIDNLNAKAEIGYWLDVNMTGKGIMQRACKALISYSFDELKLNRVWIKTAVGNKKSAAIPVNLGFYFEGIERDGELLNGKFHDLMVYSMLKNEWKQ